VSCCLQGGEESGERYSDSIAKAVSWRVGAVTVRFNCEGSKSNNSDGRVRRRVA